MTESETFDAVVIGASAGGVEALLTLLGKLPDDFPVPIILVIHLPPDRPSSLASVLNARLALEVTEAEDKIGIQPGTVYVAPANYHLLVEPQRYLSLSCDEPVHYSRPAIDLLFESAAFAFGKRLLGIVLTGASEDGAKGAQVVKACGGRIWVQDPAEALAKIMPAAVIRQAGADYILPIDLLGERLATIQSQNT
jgi:two-component system, chemotaxis family, protein-glutamate methylesterase/glutaminase